MNIFELGFVQVGKKSNRKYHQVGCIYYVSLGLENLDKLKDKWMQKRVNDSINRKSHGHIATLNTWPNNSQ